MSSYLRDFVVPRESSSIVSRIFCGRSTLSSLQACLLTFKNDSTRAVTGQPRTKGPSDAVQIHHGRVHGACRPSPRAIVSLRRSPSYTGSFVLAIKSLIATRA